MSGIPTQITVRVIANDGKFLADDIGGAAITIRDAETRAVLASGVTRGDSGPNYVQGANPPEPGLMGAQQMRGDPILMNPTNSDYSSNYTTTLNLSAPTKIEVTAFGPLGARGSANTATVTTWIVPGLNYTAGNGLLIELSGLICQIISPPTHTTLPANTSSIPIATNIAMMCGCPISIKPVNTIIQNSKGPWLPTEFLVSALIQYMPAEPAPLPNPVTVNLNWDQKTAGSFIGGYSASSGTLAAGNYVMTVIAVQPATNNTGVDVSAFTIKSPPPS